MKGRLHLDKKRQVSSKSQNDYVLLVVSADPLYLSPVCFIAFFVHVQVHWKADVKLLQDTRRMIKVFWLYGLNKGGIKLVIGKADGKQATSIGNVVFSPTHVKENFNSNSGRIFSSYLFLI